jgi:hypothetical protein
MMRVINGRVDLAYGSESSEGQTTLIGGAIGPGFIKLSNRREAD